MERIEEWLLTTSIVYVINKTFLSKSLILEIVNYFYKIGIPEIIIIDELGNNPELLIKNKYFRYYYKDSYMSVDDIIKEPEKHCCMNNIVIMINDRIYYHSGYINKDYLENIIYDMNKRFQIDYKHIAVK
ncbi:hypothetical protein [Acidiphilium sp. C61]|uniref:hypothetical protein n=1 Tax=Acidiphilium sp. C61 TaxID=1671485 RepID=UPI001F2A9FFB|nr:hypothetical protein [Acidiphilium sp. C61]